MRAQDERGEEVSMDERDRPSESSGFTKSLQLGREHRQRSRLLIVRRLNCK